MRNHHDAKINDLAFAVLNEYRVRTNFVPEDYGRHFPTLVDALAGRIRETIDEYIFEIDGTRPHRQPAELR
jgi:hypothetical protein